MKVERLKGQDEIKFAWNLRKKVSPLPPGLVKRKKKSQKAILVKHPDVSWNSKNKAYVNATRKYTIFRHNGTI